MPTKKRFTDDSYRKEPWFRSLCQAFVACKNEEDMANFLRDISTLSELQSFSERLEVAKQLVKGLSYREVAKNTGASTTTVTRVAKFIENGEGGYRKVLHAHRHHRLITNEYQKKNMNNNSEQSGGDNLHGAQEEAKNKNVSVLQKYLSRK